MRTRQLRISDRDTIRRRLKEFVGKTITVVLDNQMAVVGHLLTADSAIIELENMRLKKMRYALDSVSEIYYDTLA